MKQKKLSKKDRRIIWAQLNPYVFNCLVGLVVGAIVILILPWVIIPNDKDANEHLIVTIQVICSAVIFVGLAIYFLKSAVNLLSDLSGNIKNLDRKVLINKETKPRRGYIIYSPGNINEENEYIFHFDNMSLRVTKAVYESFAISDQIDLFYTPKSKLLLDFDGKNYTR